MLAERELSGPADHWMALANEGKGFGHSICVIMLLCIFIEIGTRFVNSRILIIIIFQQKKDDGFFKHFPHAYNYMYLRKFGSLIILWEVKEAYIILYSYYQLYILL